VLSWRRVRALEESGFCTGNRAEIYRHTFGLGVLSLERLDARRNSGNVLINLPNVKHLHTSLSLGEVKASAALTLGHLLMPAAKN